MTPRAGLIACSLSLAAALSAVAQSVPIAEKPGKPAPVEVMILGMYHMANPGLDVANVKVDNMLLPERQLELEQMAAAVERFHPTKVAVEEVSPGAGYVLKSPLDAADLKSKVDEVYQVGERIALGAGVDRLYGVDCKGDLDFDALQALDQRMGSKRMDAIVAEAQSFAAEATKELQEGTVSQSLAWVNTQEQLRRNQAIYMKALEIQEGNEQPAAKLDAAWYERNLRIWGRLMQVAKPGDRIVVVFGQGHAFWLQALAEQMPGYRLIDPVPYLRAAPPKRVIK